MTLFNPIEYNKRYYPPHINCSIKEIAGRFAKDSIIDVPNYSLHTEFAFNLVEFSDLAKQYSSLVGATVSGVPQLWKSRTWALEFADFIEAITSGHAAPVNIEIHPPFVDYCSNFAQFFEVYSLFEERMATLFPNATICIENRTGTMYPCARGGFLISDMNSITEFLRVVEGSNTKLRLVIDYPQVFTAEEYSADYFPIDDFAHWHNELTPYKHLISGIHIWGRRGRSHAGNLNDLFGQDEAIKKAFLFYIINFYNDDIMRYFVPEVNSGKEDVASIVEDFIEAGATFGR